LWYHTCGEPVCIEDAGVTDSGVPACTSQQVGQACMTVGQECDPGVGCGVVLECATSDPTKPGCPISRRSAKRDIEYLSAEDRLAETRELLSMRLVRYRDPGQSADEAQRLGFIGGSAPASDLYGYTSMAVAALQSQQAEIQELRARLKELEAKAATRSPAP
jgi:hypothetical protein